jgi:hypothetical protein
MPTLADTSPRPGALRDAPLDRLVCLQRHWTWAEEARMRFQRELTRGVEYDEDSHANHPFGSFYHWCALLSGFSEAALDHALLSPSQFEAIRQDLVVSLPGLLRCREILVAIPSVMEAQAFVLDLLRDRELLDRLGRLHDAFGEAIRQDHVARQIDSLDP